MQLEHDGLLNIAIGKSRKEMNWKNTDMLWSDLLKRLENTTYTAETHSVYMSSSVSRQGEIKDVGGFVGGYVNGGKRKNGHIAYRQILTLDVDFGTLAIWGQLNMLYGCTAAVYTTHKHTPEKPRIRILIPLDRPVFVDEYQAIARGVAGKLGINDFDDTTFEPTRLMYWPSTSKDGEYVFKYTDGPWLCADDILNSYFDWTDSSSWPMSDRVDAIIRRGIKKQEDPTEKPGLIGAFCRSYTIQEAIDKFLAEDYAPCTIENRYTYAHGSTAAGLVVYDDKFAFSHHGTDPVSGKLCNAFDLVRLHKFGPKDENAKENTASNRLPSFIAMTEFVAKDSLVKKRIANERLEGSKDDFSEPFEDIGDTIDDDWLGELEVDGKGRTKPTIDNVLKILTNDRLLKNKFAMNEFEHRAVITEDLPWRAYNPINPYLIDGDDAGLRHYLEKRYGVSGSQKIYDGLNLVMLKNKFNPVKEYLEGLQWDKTKRVSSLLTTYFGAKDSEYARAVIRKSLVAAVARIYNPGVKFDYVLTLVGKPGTGKSTFFKKLGRAWFSDSVTTVQGKDACEQIQGVWIIELGEMGQLKKAEVETIKQFISRQVDIFRVAYGRHTEHFPRQCVFFGTTNKGDFLRDPTGNRRFWPVDIMEAEPAKSVFTDLDEDEVDQIWAEAVKLYKTGETLYLSRELEHTASEHQESHSEENEKVGLVQAFLEKPITEDWYKLDIYKRREIMRSGEDDIIRKDVTVKRDRVCISEIWFELFGKDLADLDSRRANELRDVMRKVSGWAPYDLSKDKGRLRFGKEYDKQKAYTRVK